MREEENELLPLFYVWGDSVRDLPSVPQDTAYGLRHSVQGFPHSHSLFAQSNNWEAGTIGHIRNALKHFTIPTVQCQRVESSSFVLAHLNESEIFVSILMSYVFDLFLCVGRGKPLKQIKPAYESVEIIPAVTAESLMDTSIKQISS